MNKIKSTNSLVVIEHKVTARKKNSDVVNIAVLLEERLPLPVNFLDSEKRGVSGE